RLTAEPGLEGGVAGEVGAQDLDGDRASEPGVVADVHLGHAAASDELADLVAGREEPRCCVHRRPSLSSGGGTVLLVVVLVVAATVPGVLLAGGPAPRILSANSPPRSAMPRSRTMMAHGERRTGRHLSHRPSRP